LPAAFNRFTGSEDWSLIEEASVSGYRRAKKHADTVISLFLEGKERGDLKRAEKEIERQVLRPLGIGRSD
jgi:hypothetical protein